MNPEAVEALLAMEEYSGTLGDFLRESVSRIQCALNCSPEEADRILQDLRRHGTIEFEITPGGELPLPPTGIPVTRWYWYVRPAA